MKLTIITVCLNAESCIEKTIQSVLNQTFTDYEYIIKDGCSIDKTIEIVRSYQSKSNRIIVYLGKDNGIYDAMNKAVACARGQYIYFLNAGDVLYENHTLENIFRVCGDEDIIYGDVIFGNARKRSPKILNKLFFLNERMVCHQAIIAKKETLLSHPFMIKYKYCADREWLSYSVSRWKYKYYNIIISKYNTNGVSSNLANFQRDSLQLIIDQYGNTGAFFVRIKRLCSRYLRNRCDAKNSGHKKKNSILLIGAGGQSWIGGLYYIKNIAFSLMQNEYITNNYNIILLCDKSAKDVFEVFTNKVNIRVRYANINNPTIRHLYILYMGLFTSSKFVFPSSIYIRRHIRGISWIPDFQYLHFPNNFSKEEVTNKNKHITYLSNNNIPVILSSNDCLHDYVTNFPTANHNAFVVHFVSYIAKDIYDISEDYEINVLKKYNLNDTEYIFVTNQFWKHKNHCVVLDAIKIFSKYIMPNKVTFVFSGKFDDYRNPEYIKTLKKKFEDPIIAKYSVNLGFLPRKEQLTIMKNSKFIIQPSLSEGWGTVLEDAKVLDKRTILSNISVHREQMNDRCMLFDPYDPADLANKIMKMLSMTYDDNIEAGIKDMYARAKEYSKTFEQCLKENIYW